MSAEYNEAYLKFKRWLMAETSTALETHHFEFPYLCLTQIIHAACVA